MNCGGTDNISVLLHFATPLISLLSTPLLTNNHLQALLKEEAEEENIAQNTWTTFKEIQPVGDGILSG